MVCIHCEPTQGSKGGTEIGVCANDSDMQSLMEIPLWIQNDFINRHYQS